MSKPPKFVNLMLDLESMGKRSDAAIVSIGACFFHLGRREIGPTFLQTIDLRSAVREGGTMDAGTVLWWLRQGQEARNSISTSGRLIREVLTDFSDFILETCRHEDVVPWGNSPRFDMEKLDTAYRRLDLTAPWYWTNERDFRTMRNVYPQVVYDPEEKGDGNHNALTDAIFQANHLIKINDYRINPKGSRTAA